MITKGSATRVRPIKRGKCLQERRSLAKQAGAENRAVYRGAVSSVGHTTRLDEKKEKERALAMLARQHSMDYSRWMAPAVEEGDEEAPEGEEAVCAGSGAGADGTLATAATDATTGIPPVVKVKPRPGLRPGEDLGAALTRVLATESSKSKLGIGVSVVSIKPSFWQ